MGAEEVVGAFVALGVEAVYTSMVGVVVGVVVAIAVIPAIVEFAAIALIADSYAAIPAIVEFAAELLGAFVALGIEAVYTTVAGSIIL